MILGFLSSIKECHAKHEQWSDGENDCEITTEHSKQEKTR